MDFLTFALGDGYIDYDDRAKRLLDMVDVKIESHSKVLGKEAHVVREHVIREAVGWIRREYPKESEPWVKAINRLCVSRYPGFVAVD